MRLGDFRRETKDLPDDYILDGVWFVEAIPGYYDGYPKEIFRGSDDKFLIKCTNEPKIRFRMFEIESWFYDICDNKKTYHENLELVLSHFVIGENVSDDRWASYIESVKMQFNNFWIMFE